MGLKNLGSTLKTAQTKHKPKEIRRAMLLDDVQKRPHGDSRPLDPAHVDELMKSIEAIGLIQAIAVDQNGCLLAGGHRLAALNQLREQQQQQFEKLFPSGIPVRVMDFDAAATPEMAIAVETTENEKRKDYTPQEVRELADRLVKAGYTYGSKGGKPKKGGKALRPALAFVIGKSERTVARYLNPEKSETETHVPVCKWAKEIKVLERIELNASEEAGLLAGQLRELLLAEQDKR